MIELSETSAVEYLRAAGRVSAEGEVLVQSLSGGVSNVVLKVFDTAAGEKVGTDLRTPGQIKQGKPDVRMSKGECFVIKQPLGKFRTAAEWLVDIERVLVERDCMTLLGELLPAKSVPQMLWFDEPNFVLAMECAPLDAVIWKKELLAGNGSMEAAAHAGMLLAMMHSSTMNDAAVEKRYGDPKFFIQQRVDAYLHATAERQPTVGAKLHEIGEQLLKARQCLIHGDYSPKNILMVPHEDGAEAEGEGTDGAAGTEGQKAKKFPLSHLMLLDFEVAFYGHVAFDVATLINHLLLKGFYHGKKWRPFMMMADNFWQTYQHTVSPALKREADRIGGHVLGALLLARVDGKSPAEYLVGQPEKQERVRKAALDILRSKEGSVEAALDRAAMYFEDPDAEKVVPTPSSAPAAG